MKTLELNLPTPVLLVWGLPEVPLLNCLPEFHRYKDFLMVFSDNDVIHFKNGSDNTKIGTLPEGNWQLIGKLSELTDFNTRKAIKDKGYHIMNPYMMPNSRNYSAKQLENDNSDYWNKYNKWQEAQSKTLPANTLIFKRV